MAIYPYQYINLNGVPTLEVQRINVTDTSVDFIFRRERGINPFRGLLLIYVPEAIPTGTTGTLPIRFVEGSNIQNVTEAGNTNVTVSTFPGVGIYLVYYDTYANILQII